MNKVIHIIENFNKQATENWLFQIMRHLAANGERFDWTFYATLGIPGAMDDAVRALGGKIIYSPVPLQKRIRFLSELRKFIKEGNYDIFHSHHDIVSAVYILATLGLPLKKRIVHVHNTSLSIPTPSPLKNALLHEPMRQLCLHLADKVVGVSSPALMAFLDKSRYKTNRDVIIHCGIDTAPFHTEPPNRLDFLKSLGLPNHAKILLFVGRMIEYKNPCFVIDILKHASKFEPNICAIFAGSGPLEHQVREMARHNSLENRVKVLGWHNDIASLMLSCDILIVPGLEEPKEGLGLVVVEAQAAGLPVLMSLSVPDEAIVEPNLVNVLPLHAGVEIWANNILKVINQRPQYNKDALAVVESSSFAIAQSTENIQKLYEL